MLKTSVLVAGLVIGSSAPAAAQAEPEALSLEGTGTIVVITEPAEQATFTFRFPFEAEVGVNVDYGVAPGAPWTEERRTGSYVVRLVDGLGANWEVTDITCVEGGGPTPSSGDVQARTATFGIDPGEDVTCTFTLSQGHGTIAVETDPPGGDVDYEFMFPFPPDFGGSVSRSVGPEDPWHEKRAAGTYLVSMLSEPVAWELTDVSCDDAGSETPSTGDADARTATFGIDPGEEVVCTFTVSQGQGTIKLESDPEDDELSLTFGFPLPPDVGASFSQTVTPGRRWTEDRRPGSYEVSMISELPEPWELEAIDCDDEASERPSRGNTAAMTADYGLDPGEHVTCTWKLRDPTMPRSGPWRVREISNKASCQNDRVEKLLDKKLDEESSGTRSGSLRLTDKGMRMVATGAQPGRVTLRRVTREEGVYKASKQRTRFVWTVRSPEHIVGTTTVTLGGGCQTRRTFDMRFIGE